MILAQTAKLAMAALAGALGPDKPARRFRFVTDTRLRLAIAVLCVLLAPGVLRAQETDPSVLANQQKARRVLDATILALGGTAWLGVQSIQVHGHASGFYQGRPSGSIVEFFEAVQPPDKERIAFTKKKNVVQIFVGRQGWEITYKGSHALPHDQLDEYLRRHDHSLRVVLQQWYKDPQTALIYDEQTLVERRLADKVTLLNKDNDSVTLEMDAENHLPRRVSWEWRDPEFHDMDHDAEEYDNYHIVDGIATPFTVSRYHNGDMTNERYINSVQYNVPLRADLFDTDATAQHLR